MRPFYERNGITIYLGDSWKIIPAIERFNVIVTSPPYNQSLDKFHGSGMHRGGKWVYRMRRAYSDSLSERDYQNRMAILFGQCAEKIPANGSIFVNHKCRFRDGHAILPIQIPFSPALELHQEIIWDRSAGIQFNSGRFCPSDERVLWFKRHNGLPKWKQSQVGKFTVWKIRPVVSEDGPPQFPVELVANCILATTDKRDIVFDPFMGSGTTAFAAKKLGRRFIGIELQPKYCRMAIDRIEGLNE